MPTLRLETRDTLRVLRFDKPRGNAIDSAFVDDLREAVRELAADGSARGVLLASAHPTLFSPGLDLQALSELDRAGMGEFMARFARMVWALYGLAKPVVAAVNGHAVAGGCILALTADYRVLRRGAQIGLNEVKVGVPLPWSVALLLRASSPPAALSRIALLGRNFCDEEAVAAGLADEVAAAEGFEATCLARLNEFAEKDPYAIATTKGYLRAGALREMEQREADLAREWLDAWFSPATRERVQQIVAGLKAKG